MRCLAKSAFIPDFLSPDGWREVQPGRSIAGGTALLYIVRAMNAPRNDKVNLGNVLRQIEECWSPVVVGELNGQAVKLARLEGEFIWHHHADEDEGFLVLRGQLSIQLRDRTVELNEGEFFIVPRGVEHRPVARAEAHVLLFEPATTLNTGNVRNERTIDVLKRVAPRIVPARHSG